MGYIPDNMFVPLSTIKQFTDTRGYEVKFEIEDASSTDFDHYNHFALTGTSYSISLGSKVDSSPSLSSIDLFSDIDGLDFKLAGSSCYSTYQVGSWYGPSC